MSTAAARLLLPVHGHRPGAGSDLQLARGRRLGTTPGDDACGRRQRSSSPLRHPAGVPPPATPLPPSLSGRPFRVSEALALGVTRERLRGSDLLAPSYGVRSPLALGWDALVRARCGVLVVPAGSLVVGLDAVALAGLPSPVTEDELLRLPLEVDVPMALREPRPRTGVRARLGLCRRGLPTVTELGVTRPADEDVWVRVCGASTSPLGHTAAVRMGQEVLARSGGRTEAVEAAVARAPRPVALRAGRLLAAVLAAQR